MLYLSGRFCSEAETAGVREMFSRLSIISKRLRKCVKTSNETKSQKGKQERTVNDPYRVSSAGSKTR
jgi:hypothetical protein